MDPVTKREVFGIAGHRTFREVALKVFYDQSAHVPVYREYLANLGTGPEQVREVEAIPFLPVEFFRTHRVLRDGSLAETVFESSGTTSSSPSVHYLADRALYLESLIRGFEWFYGDPASYCILALLPSFGERKASSLAFMLDQLIHRSPHPDSGFYLGRMKELAGVLERRNRDKQKTLLLGVSFALLDLAEMHPMDLEEHIIVMETGGMKGRRNELVREELHSLLKEAFGLPLIHSEYGMTELLSQAYSPGKGIFHTPPWMQVLLRDPDDPLSLMHRQVPGKRFENHIGTPPGDPMAEPPGDPMAEPPAGRTGGLNIIDLANLHSCSFIATGDLGRLHLDGGFEVLGRFDHSEIRGCNLLV